MNFFIKPFAAIFFAIAVLTGCQSTPKMDSGVPPVNAEEAFDRNQDRLSNLSAWHFEGRFSLKSKQRAESASLSWLQQNNDYLLKISGPLNQGTIFIRGNPQTISYKDSKGTVDSASSPEELISRHTDYELPVSSLRYWVLGRPDPHFAYDLKIDEYGNLQSLTQNGWKIKYETFTVHDRYRLPTKIVLKHPDVTLTMSMHQWTANLMGQ